MTAAAIQRTPAAMPLRAGESGIGGALRLARIDETACIGCTLCIAACPVDAIIGAAKRMHVVLAAFCTGCELCLAPCPVDCIRMVPAGRSWSEEDERAAQARQDARLRRMGDRQAETEKPGASQGMSDAEAIGKRRKAVAAALDRARARRAPEATKP